ncbi:MAG: hypothetical protein JXR94_01990, partial [Candidatus Hydrogenedentes bacterium]|nr:hypothetical protein [Candidatus Hydrogenedentota bacterium]
MRHSILITVILATIAFPAAAAFELAETAELGLSWRGEPLIVADGFSGEAGLPTPDDTVVTPLDGGAAVNVYRATSDTLDYRREAALRDGACELVFRARLYPYHGLEAASYELRIPAPRLDGFTYRSVTDRPYRQKVLEGVLSAGMADGSIAGGLAFLTLDSPAGGLTFDFAPSGRALYYNVRNKGFVGNAWALRKEGDSFVLSVGMTTAWYGAMLTTKVVIHDGVLDYDAIHPAPDAWHYAMVPQTTLALAAYEPAPEGFQPLTADPFREGASAGWESAEGVAAGPGVLGGSVVGRAGTLRLSAPPGQYLATVRFGAESALGPFALAADGTPIRDDLRSEPGAVTSFTFPWRIAGDARLRFDSAKGFGVSAVILQRLLTPYEVGHTLTDSIWAVGGIPTPDKDID